MSRLSSHKQRLASSSSHQSQTDNQKPGKSPTPNKLVRLNNTCFRRENSIRFTAGTRPYREAGIRMQKEVVGNKVFYHNYGHGGGGLSVGYGSAWELIQKEFLPQQIPQSEEIAVLGAGIIGLTTAYLLAEQGYNVNVYADIYPFVTQQGKPELTSTVAGGYWMPLKLGNKEQTKQIAKLTWDHYHEIMAIQQQTGRQLGITKMPAYCVNDDEGLTYFQIEGIIEPKKIQVCFENGVPYEAITFPTLVIEASRYLPYLMERMQHSGRVRFHKQLLTKKTLLLKNETYIFNCCGLNGSDFFGDQCKVKGIKGHVWHFNLRKQRQVEEYILFLKTKQGRWLFQVPHLQSNKLILGISYEEGKKDSFPELQEANKTLETAQKFYQSVSPSIKNTNPVPRM